MMRTGALPPQQMLTLQAINRVVGAAGDAMIAFDRDLRYVHFSAGMERLTGMTAAEVLGRKIYELFPFLREDCERLHAAVLRGETHSAEGRSYDIPETGRRGTYDAYYSPLFDGDTVVAGVGVVRDTTELKRVRQELQETENRFRNMADVAPVLLWMAGTDSLCTFFNQTWLDFTGRTLEEEWGVGWVEGVHFEDLQRCMDVYQAAFGRRERFEMEYRIRRSDGQWRWVLDRGTPRYTPDGTFAGFIGSCADITEHKRLEAELRQAVQARDEFLSIAAHELRTPLTPIQLGVQYLLRSEPRDPKVLTQKLHKLDEHVHRQAQLVEKLLDVSRLAAGGLQLELSEHDLDEIVRAMLQQFADEARRAECELLLTSVPARGRWDRGRLEQIASNLIANAIKYGKGAPVEVTVEPLGDARVRLAVRDHGIGIAVEDQPRVFERFARAVSVRHFPGFGLGLWITRTLVEAMNGTVVVESRPGEGALFCVELPCSPSLAGVISG